MTEAQRIAAQDAEAELAILAWEAARGTLYTAMQSDMTAVCVPY